MLTNSLTAAAPSCGRTPSEQKVARLQRLSAANDGLVILGVQPVSHRPRMDSQLQLGSINAASYNELDLSLARPSAHCALGTAHGPRGGITGTAPAAAVVPTLTRVSTAVSAGPDHGSMAQAAQLS